MTFQNHQPDERCGEVEDKVERDSSLANWVKMSYFSNLKIKQHMTREHVTGDYPRPRKEPVQMGGPAAHASSAPL